MFDEQGSPQMYANLLLSTDGSDVARKGVKHGIALAKALNAKMTVITVTEPLPNMGANASGWIPSPEEFDHFDAACKKGAVEGLAAAFYAVLELPIALGKLSNDFVGTRGSLPRRKALAQSHHVPSVKAVSGRLMLMYRSHRKAFSPWESIAPRPP